MPQSQFAAEDYLYEERLDWAKLRKLARIPSNVYNILQASNAAIFDTRLAGAHAWLVHMKRA